MPFRLSQRSLKALVGVHPDLVRVVKTAIKITAVDFVVIEGLRTPARQAQLVKAGASRTLNSRHLSGHAVDLAVWLGTVRWEFPLYQALWDAMQAAGRTEGVPVQWGGLWRSRDGPHFQLPWASYPSAATDASSAAIASSNSARAAKS